LLEQSYKAFVRFQVLFFAYFRQISAKAYGLQGRSNDPSLFVALSFGSVRRQTARPFTMTFSYRPSVHARQCCSQPAVMASHLG